MFLLNTRRRIRGHQLVSTGTNESVNATPTSVFRLAVAASAAAIVMAHNHPSGDPTPSSADVQLTREFVKAGRLLRVEVLDHVVIGARRHQSLREMGMLDY